MMRISIDKDMVLVKLTYLLWGGLVGTYNLYLNPFYVSIGIPRSKVGVITGIPFAVSVIASPLWGLLTGYTGRQRFILVVLCICSAVWISSLPLIANVVAERSAIQNNISHGNSSFLRITQNFTLEKDGISAMYNVTTINWQLIKKATSLYVNNSNQLTSHGSNKVVHLGNPIINTNTMFYTFFIVMALGSVFFSCVAGYVEAIALKAIKVSPKGATYGGQRVCGSIGACVMTYFTGVLLDNFPIENLSEFSILFFSYPIFPLLLIPMGLLLIQKHNKWAKMKTPDLNMDPLAKNERVETKASLRSQLLATVLQVDFLFLLFTAFVAGLSFGMIFFKMFLFNEQLNISKTKISFAFSVGSFSNIVMFPFTSLFIKLLRGPIPTIIFGLFVYCLRHVLMSYITTYWTMILLQGLSGFSFGSLWASFMNYVHDIAPVKIKTTMIVLVQSTHFGLGCFVCNAVGGHLYAMFDAKTLFRWNGAMCGVWGFVLIVYFGVRNKQKQLLADESVPVVSEMDTLVKLEDPSLQCPSYEKAVTSPSYSLAATSPSRLSSTEEHIRLCETSRTGTT